LSGFTRLREVRNIRCIARIPRTEMVASNSLLPMVDIDADCVFNAFTP
jgi:hypothetical protein